MKAIETVYNGYRFRSRLEARWATFFDILGIPYEYEKEGYMLEDVAFDDDFIPKKYKGGFYLPDFWLPQQDCFVEIKGQQPTEDESDKAFLLAYHSGKHVYIMAGDIYTPDFDEYSGIQGYYNQMHYKEGSDEFFYVWCECPHCHKLGIQYEGRAARLCDCEEKIEGHDWGRGHNPDSPRLIVAYTAARQARFEHGEKGYHHD